MSRFAIDPRWLVYLPPTMSPVATRAAAACSSTPSRRSTAYRAARRRRRSCARRSTWARARSRWSAGRRGGARAGSARRRGGRRGLDADRPAVLRPTALTAELLARLRAAADAAGLFDELGHRLAAARRRADAVEREGRELLRDQYAAVGAAAARRAARRRRRAGTGRAPAASTSADAARPHAVAGRQRGRVHRRVPAVLLADRRPGRHAARAVPAARPARGTHAGAAARLASRRWPTGWPRRPELIAPTRPVCRGHRATRARSPPRSTGGRS